MKERNERARDLRSFGFPAATMGWSEEDVNALSLSSSGIFRGPVSSVYDRLQAREALEQQKQAARASSAESTEQNWEDTGVWTKAGSERLSNPSVPLIILERMQLVFILYEWCRKRKRRSASCLSDANLREMDMMNDLDAMIDSRERELSMRGVLKRSGEYLPASDNAASMGTLMTAGIPFSVFERFIVEPYFDVLFPPIRTGRRTVDSFMDTLGTCGCSSTETRKISFNFTGRSQRQKKTSYQRKRASHVEAAENLFSVMDTNGDGFLSWDEFSGYILQCGQRDLLAGGYDSGDGVNEGKPGGGNDATKTVRNTTNISNRYMNFTPTPLNVNPWQQQCPLVRHLYHSEPISRLLFANRGRRYITAAWDGLVKVWRPNPRLADAYGKPSIVHERTIFTAGAPIVDMVLSPASLGDAEILAVVGMDGTVTLLSVVTGEVLKTFIGRCSLPPSAGLGWQLNPSKRRELEETHVKNVVDPSLLEEDIRENVEGGAVVLRPVFKVRAYRREAIEIFFTEVSRYFIGLDVVAPTYEHLEQRRAVKTDVLLQFGDGPETPVEEAQKQRFPVMPFVENEVEWAKEATNSTGWGTIDEDAQFVKEDNLDDKNLVEDKETLMNEYPAPQKKKPKRKPIRDIRTPATYLSSSFFHEYSTKHIRACNKCWFARSVAFARYERTNSASVLPPGVFLLLGFETGFLQFYQLRPQLFTISNLSMTRLEVPTTHKPVLILKLHRKAITSILTSEAHDLLVTASDDGTVVVRQMSRLQLPYVTLGDGVPAPDRPPPVHPNGHTKRITCICWHETRNLIVTGGADRIIIFWTPSSSRQLYRIDLRIFSTSSGSSGTPIDASFFEPLPHSPLLLILDTRRVLYFIDTVSYQCLHILRDDGLSSLKAGDMLRARYDLVDHRLILGGRHVRSWDIRQRDEYPEGYCGHRRPVIGLAYQQAWSLWVSADDSVVIIWNTKVVDLRLGERSSMEQVREEGAESNSASHSTLQLARKGYRWSAQTDLVRSWSVDGGICCFAVDQSESSHVFVALLHERHILEYNSFNGSVLRSFDFPAEMGDISSLACGVTTGGRAFLRPVSFLCGTFEREQSPNGTTALYALASGSDVLSAVESTSGVHRSILTTGVGVSCAIIVAALGLVVVCHRGGISVTPVAEATTCPIACLRLTDTPMRRKPDRKKGENVAASDQPRAPTQHLRTTTTTTVTPSTSTTTNIHRGQRRPLTYPNVQSEEKGHCRPSPPLDLVALLTGPLLQDPVALTREFMQQRERYLFYNGRPKTSFTGTSLGSRTESNATSTENEEEERNSRDAELPPLLLFSDEFIAASSVFTGNFGVLLREQLAALGYVGQIVPIRETGYAVSGGDDGVVQFWNLRTLSEVMRYRVTYTLEAVTAMEFSDDGFYLAVGDASGYILLIDMHLIAWDSAVPLEMVSGIESDVFVLRRWRGHRQSATSVRFVRQTEGMIHLSTVHSQTAKKNAPFRRPPRQGLESDVAAADDNNNIENKTDSNQSSKHEAIFLCTSGEDSYIYTWCWEARPSIGGSVHCIGCFGGGVEAPPKPPVDKLTDAAWQVLELVRKVYIEERLLSPGGALSGTKMQVEIHTAVLELMEEMRAVKSGAQLPRLGAAPRERQSQSFPSLLRTRNYSRVPHSDSVQFAAERCPPTYVLAFEEGLYYDRGIVELLERIVTELRAVQKRRQSVTNVASRHVSLVEPRRSRKSLQTAPNIFLEKNTASDETRSALTFLSLPDTTTGGTATVTATSVGNAATYSMRRSTNTRGLSLTGPSLFVSQTSPPESYPRSDFGNNGTVGGGGGGSSTDGPRAARSGMGGFSFPFLATSTVAQSSMSPTLTSPEPLAVRSLPSLGTPQQDSPLFRMNEGDWSPLPPVTVGFKKPSPLPRPRFTGKKGAENGGGCSTTLNSLPLTADIVGTTKTKGDDAKRRYRGVKVLLREKARRRSHNLLFVDNVKKRLSLQEADDVTSGNPEDRRAARRERKRRSTMWEAARIMNTLMAWKAPRESNRSPIMSGVGPEGGLVECAPFTDPVKAPNFKFPMFIPLTLGTSHAMTSRSSLQLDLSKSMSAMLKTEMLAMNATLQAALHEKQVLMAQERAAAAGNTTPVQTHFGTR
ncbi:hypothetical protein C3747_70g162 [Trypanosoma cruzi]|uniref:EF-hand domain-containing protein n=2 Tax=Trypanosoma cruzi TaxID=5693 RepID=Q4DZ34_TRYCC|nr:hypothetical protein, conserved [Trypanosoma cruzi]EAN97777.1 hypothetical protein, conserved [Trypanosoma cruzi]PWV10308.1 hypothetical protein C3747_70g162 [Trypanosoma cruzi]RNC61155.1 hypothetical protein TcCL_ESM01166 [Trypanosoma cruzi]|eukprot:XP_819628.1 hypothetical protein [Trypanosoma cruzi strain CL Brener]